MNNLHNQDVPAKPDSQPDYNIPVGGFPQEEEDWRTRGL